ncbi:MFS transporter [Amycolatopsis jejuensis]|uniref:MFS transporter n=1 Tax=Amycolatopsis jejuensis TaxID=330084 RepID=UPI000524AF86|nr:MFS transporter [Amycolatopsis jejuensis]
MTTDHGATDLLRRLDRLPFTRVQFGLLNVIGVGAIFESIDILALSVLLPVLSKHFGLTSADAGLLASASLLGMAVGAVIAGVLADRLGRRRIIMYALGAFSLFTMIAAFSPTWGFLFVMRTLAGIGLGAEAAVLPTYLSEFVPGRARGKYVGTLSGYLALGGFPTPLLAYAIVTPFADGWRYFLFVLGLPVFLLLWWRRRLPESPRWLLEHGRASEAEAVVSDLERRVEQRLGTPLPPVPAGKPVGRPQPADPPLQAFRRLWSGRLARRTAVVWVAIFAIQFCNWGFSSWAPSLLVSQGVEINRSLLLTAIVQAGAVPGYFISAMLSDRISRPKLVAMWMALTAMCGFAMASWHSPMSTVIFGCAVIGANGAAIGAIYTYVPEQYPTSLRGTGFGSANAFGRIGAILAPIIIGFTVNGLGAAGVFALLATVIAVGVIVLVAFGTRTNNQTLEQLSDELVASPRSQPVSRNAE